MQDEFDKLGPAHRLQTILQTEGEKRSQLTEEEAQTLSSDAILRIARANRINAANLITAIRCRAHAESMTPASQLLESVGTTGRDAIDRILQATSEEMRTSLDEQGIDHQTVLNRIKSVINSLPAPQADEKAKACETMPLHRRLQAFIMSMTWWQTAAHGLIAFALIFILQDVRASQAVLETEQMRLFRIEQEVYRITGNLDEISRIRPLAFLSHGQLQQPTLAGTDGLFPPAASDRLLIAQGFSISGTDDSLRVYDRNGHLQEPSPMQPVNFETSWSGKELRSTDLVKVYLKNIESDQKKTMQKIQALREMLKNTQQIGDTERLEATPSSRQPTPTRKPSMLVSHEEFLRHRVSANAEPPDQFQQSHGKTILLNDWLDR
ncbi:hypothetical protein ABNQ39_10470 [Azospirillum sp. A26]|uniref:hypothetical protein n=1 Tax=Azospirillum sp. A26 TaxID=3160607 RepID=UPI00366B05C4